MEIKKPIIKIEYFLGLIMLVIGLLGVYKTVQDYNGEFASIVKLLSASLTAVFGAVILIDPKKCKMRAIGFYALSLGIGRMIASLVNIPKESDFSFAIGLVMLLLGASMTYSGAMYMKGKARNALNMRYISLVMVLAICVYFAYLLHWGLPIQDVVNDNFTMVLSLILYIVQFAILSADEVWSNTPSGMLRDDINETMLVTGIHEYSKIDRPDAEIVLKSLTDRTSWNKGTGPVSEEIAISLYYWLEKSKLLFQKWNNGPIYVTTMRDSADSIINTGRFELVAVTTEGGPIESCQYIRLYGKDGTFAKLEIQEVEADE